MCIKPSNSPKSSNFDFQVNWWIQLLKQQIRLSDGLSFFKITMTIYIYIYTHTHTHNECYFPNLKLVYFDPWKNGSLPMILQGFLGFRKKFNFLNLSVRTHLMHSFRQVKIAQIFNRHVVFRGWWVDYGPELFQPANGRLIETFSFNLSNLTCAQS